MLTFKQFLHERRCWSGYVKRGTKRKNGKTVNNCVKEDASNRPVLGVVEPIIIQGVGSCEAKIDSGNEAYNVIHGINIKLHKNNHCTFDTINDKQATLPYIGNIDINIGSGNIESRPTVKLSFTLRDKQYKDIVFSLADRSQNDQPVLVGEPFIRDINALIDVKV